MFFQDEIILSILILTIQIPDSGNGREGKIAPSSNNWNSSNCECIKSRVYSHDWIGRRKWLNVPTRSGCVNWPFSHHFRFSLALIEWIVEEWRILAYVHLNPYISSHLCRYALPCEREDQLSSNRESHGQVPPTRDQRSIVSGPFSNLFVDGSQEGVIFIIGTFGTDNLSLGSIERRHRRSTWCWHHTSIRNRVTSGRNLRWSRWNMGRQVIP